MKKLNVKRLENINLLYELPFYEELNVIKTDMHVEDMQLVTKSN